MPLLSPTRIIVLAVSISLFTFFWTWGAPRELPQPSLPYVDHGESQVKPPPQPEKPLIPTELGHPPEKAQTRPTTSSVIEELSLQSTSTPTLTPTLSHILTSSIISTESAEASTTGETTGSGKQQHVETVEGQTESSSTTPVSSGRVPYPTGYNATNFTNSTIAAQSCRDIPGASHIMVIVKTSKAEIEDKLPAHIKTILSCASNFAIFSDHEGRVQNYTVHDALQDISDSTKEQHDEFKDYLKLQTADDSKPVRVSKELEKWKMLPMVYKAYKMKPHARFYIFIESDTSLSWTNLVQWTRRLDYRIPYYSGAPMTLGSVRYAQRGAGIMLSNAALQHFSRAYDTFYKSDWEKRIGNECCGDLVLSTTMTEAHVEMYGAFPMLQGENFGTLDWTERHWCAPIVSWHNMAPKEIQSLWNFEKNWTSQHGWEEPYLIRDAFRAFIGPNLTDEVHDWDNLSADTKLIKPEDGGENSKENQEWYEHSVELRNSVESWKKCKDACWALDDCLQWKYVKKTPPECHLNKIVKFGVKPEKKKDGGAEDILTSGWVVDRIRNTTRKWECNEPRWGFNQ
jgi:hypothetical protein